VLNRQRLYLNIVGIVGGLALVAALLILLQRGTTLSSSTATPLAAPPVPSVAQTASTTDIVAIVDGDVISRSEWQKAVALDRAMSQLAGQPVPSVETTLDRLINGRLVLHQTGVKFTASDSDANARLEQLQQGWRADGLAVDQTLASAGLARQDLLAEIKRLLVIETYLKQVSASQGSTAWLAAQRSKAQVGIYADLSAPVAQVSTPVSVTQAASPTPAPTQSASTQAPTVGSAPGQLAFDFSLSDVNGQRIKLSDLHGHPVVINFWATWCPPCRQEAPALQAAYQRYRDRGVIWLGVDLREDAKEVLKFASQFSLTYPLLLDGDGVVSDRYQVRGIPTTVFLDTEGVIRARHVGPLTEDKISEYLTPLLVPRTDPSSENLSGLKISPDFSLPRENGEPVHLSDYRDKSSVVLVFYRGQT
jgi:peroxiredoxin